MFYVDNNYLTPPPDRNNHLYINFYRHSKQGAFLMSTNLNRDSVFSKKISELDPAATPGADDSLLISQDNITRRASVTQLREGLATNSALQTHTSNVTNPHGVTASQTGAFTSQQTTSAINAAQTTTQGNLDAHTDNTSNPHSTTASQVGAYTKAESDGLVQTANSYTDAHVANTSNPHNVSAAEVGNDINQWNANKIQYRQVNIPFPAPDGAVIIYNAASNSFDLAVIDAGLPPHPIASVSHLPYSVSSNELYTDESGWLWYPAVGGSIGSSTSFAFFDDNRLLLLYKTLWINAGNSSGWELKNASNQIVTKGSTAQDDWDADLRLDIPNFASRTIIAAGQGPGLSTRVAGSRTGDESVTINKDNLPEIPFRRNSGAPGSSPFSITADDSKSSYDSNATGAINVGSPNNPIDVTGPTKTYSELWFCGVKA